MSKILLIGHSPPILHPNRKIEAAHYRTWQFLDSLIQDGHSVVLCVVASKDIREKPYIPEGWRQNIELTTIDFNQIGWSRQLQKIHDNYNPDCVVAVNFDICLYVTKLDSSKPIWMDIYGDILTILQAIGYRRGSNRGIPTTIGFMRYVLRKGDVFSVCGEPQKHMLVGELAMAGRLNYQAFGYNFVHTILPGAAPLVSGQNKRKSRSLLLKNGVTEKDFVVLWVGGYNAWTDIDTLFEGLQCAMQIDPNIHFVSVGENTYQANDNVYFRFKKLISNSAYKDHYHLLGWRPWQEIPDYYAGSDVGINIDSMHYETIYGTRTRCLEMISAGLPVITTLGSELSYLLENNGVALTFTSGDRGAFCNQIIKLSNDREYCQTLSLRSYHAAQNDFSFYATTQALRSWVNFPKCAPDHDDQKPGYNLREIENKGRAVLRQLIWKLTGLDK